MIRPTLTLLTSIFLFACGGGSSSNTDPVINSMDDISVRKVGIDLVNISTQSVDYYIRENGDKNALFDEGNKVATNLSLEKKYHSIQWTSNSPMTIDIGIQDTNSQTINNKATDIILNNKQKVWAIAWQDELTMSLSTDIVKPAPLEDKYRIRVFAVDDVWVQIVSSAVSTQEVKKGKFSSHMTVENCSGELFLGANQTNICDLDIGKSYLLIVDGENLLLAAEEK
ncbi:hypothetical protein [Photobacterium nomapromontoriensis]|uniref:hypothetical protein n=1 Tax=Photobacterium nomapromontoriensis TaxID=2910237 RepID=UPI003D14EF0D